jgi:hypothetical protein
LPALAGWRQMSGVVLHQPPDFLRFLPAFFWAFMPKTGRRAAGR